MSVDQLLHYLPDEVLVRIATRLPLEDFVHLQRTNRKMARPVVPSSGIGAIGQDSGY